jgi:hypothetical protein
MSYRERVYRNGRTYERRGTDWVDIATGAVLGFAIGNLGDGDGDGIGGLVGGVLGGMTGGLGGGVVGGLLGGLFDD